MEHREVGHLRIISDHVVYSDCVEAGAQVTLLGLALKCWEVVYYIYVEWYIGSFFFRLLTFY